jgi:signal transduction protein with GAF and PtsI domain
MSEICPKCGTSYVYAGNTFIGCQCSSAFTNAAAKEISRLRYALEKAEKYGCIQQERAEKAEREERMCAAMLDIYRNLLAEVRSNRDWPIDKRDEARSALESLFLGILPPKKDKAENG